LVNTNGNIFDKWKLYKAEIIVNLDSDKDRRNLIIEDYLPWSFRVINNKFKTESAVVTWASKSWRWDHIENRPDVVMANASYIYWNKATYEYYFRPEFAWTYTHPPVTSYMMYDPIIRASWEFNIITVK
jgi:uncharacterized protein YfaS (alpha-2-macroglobulin family)